MTPRLGQLLIALGEMQRMAIAITGEDLESAEDALDLALRIGRARQELDSLETDAIDVMRQRVKERKKRKDEDD